MHVLELWRYPVKSMRGVSVPEAEIRGGEVVGDRLVQVVWTSGPRAGRVVEDDGSWTQMLTINYTRKKK